MAEVHATDVKLRIVFQDGLDNEGSPIVKRKTLSRIRLAASADQLYNTAQAFASLTSYTYLEANRVETADIQPF